jgi:hypothetical protein
LCVSAWYVVVEGCGCEEGGWLRSIVIGSRGTRVGHGMRSSVCLRMAGGGAVLQRPGSGRSDATLTRETKPTP